MVGEALITGIHTQRSFRIIGNSIGAGGFASVFKVHEDRTNKDFALKLPHEGHKKRLTKEAERQKTLSHPHIMPIRLFDAINYDTSSRRKLIPFFVTPLAKTNLLTFSIKNVIDTNTAISIARQTASALITIHSQELLHCDVKPENVLLTRRSNDNLVAHIADFGSATSTNLNEQHSDDLIISPPYTAPEVYHGIRTPAIDQWGWAAGVVYPSFTGDDAYDENTHRTLRNSGHTPPRPFEEIIGPHRMTPLHDAVEEVANRALQENPLQRYPDMSALRDDLKKRVRKSKQKRIYYRQLTTAS